MCNFALHMSLPTKCVILRYICRCQQYEICLAPHVKCPIFLTYFNQIWILSTDFRRGPQYKISRNPAQWDKWNDRQTDMTQPIGVIRDLRERD
jgi:hypothetical protein